MAAKDGRPTADEVLPGLVELHEVGNRWRGEQSRRGTSLSSSSKQSWVDGGWGWHWRNVRWRRPTNILGYNEYEWGGKLKPSTTMLVCCRY